MTAFIIMGLIIIVAILIAVITIKRNIELKKDFEDEKDRSQQFRVAMYDGVALAGKAEKIDRSIEEKKNERKKKSKADKIASANNRANRP